MTRRPIVKAFGAIVREAREGADLTQEKLAFRAGVHSTYVSQLETGLRNPSLEIIAKIAKGLHIPLHELIRRSEDRLA